MRFSFLASRSSTSFTRTASHHRVKMWTETRVSCDQQLNCSKQNHPLYMYIIFCNYSWIPLWQFREEYSKRTPRPARYTAAFRDQNGGGTTAKIQGSNTLGCKMQSRTRKLLSVVLCEKHTKLTTFRAHLVETENCLAFLRNAPLGAKNYTISI